MEEIKVAKQFADDFEVVAKHYGMEGEEKEDFRRIIRRMLADDPKHCASWMAKMAFTYADDRPEPKEGVTPYRLKPFKTLFEE